MRGPRCVLFVEDNADDYSMAVHELVPLQLQNKIIRVASTDELLQYLRAVYQYLDRDRYPLPAVILLDLNLPGGDALEAHTMLRANLKFRRIPLVTISNPINATLLKKTVELGADAWLSKPFQRAEFLRITQDLKVDIQFANDSPK